MCPAAEAAKKSRMNGGRAVAWGATRSMMRSITAHFAGRVSSTLGAIMTSFCALLYFGILPAWAAAGHADPGEIGLQTPVTPIAQGIDAFHN